VFDRKNKDKRKTLPKKNRKNSKGKLQERITSVGQKK
jgi:hypothetical protein